jgi:hypothetical protein
MSILFTVSFVVLNQSAAEAANEFSELGHLEPRAAAELFAVIDGEDDLRLDTMGPEPRDDVQVPAQAIGP